MLKKYLEQHGHKVFQTDLDTLLPFIHNIKFESVSDDDTHSYFIPVEQTNMVEKALNAIQTIIAEEYLRPNATFVEFLQNRIWKGIAVNSDKWHNDVNESPNVFFLLYFNDMTLTDTGAFLIKDDFEKIERVLPTPGTLIAVENTISKYYHRAEYTDSTRIVASFNYKVDWHD
jgi:hypothetical protein